jgi:ribonuclease P protein component
MRFRPEQHLRRQSDIRVVREQGRRVDCRAFTVWWKRRDTIADLAAAPGLPRVCVVASTAAVGNAVRRNRAKRRLRETFRHHQHLVPPACDLMLVARAAAQHLPITELAKKFSDACALIAPPRPPASPSA